MPDQAPLDYQSGFTSALQLELEELFGSSSVSRVSRSAPRKPQNFPVSNAVACETKLQQQCIITDMYILQTVL